MLTGNKSVNNKNRKSFNKEYQLQLLAWQRRRLDAHFVQFAKEKGSSKRMKKKSDDVVYLRKFIQMRKRLKRQELNLRDDNHADNNDIDQSNMNVENDLADDETLAKMINMLEKYGMDGHIAEQMILEAAFQSNEDRQPTTKSGVKHGKGQGNKLNKKKELNDTDDTRKQEKNGVKGGRTKVRLSGRLGSTVAKTKAKKSAK